MIEIKNLSKTFGSKFTRKNKVLDNVSFTLPDKGLFAIFGKSGSGKTTLLNIIGGLDKEDSGYVIIEGERLDRNRDNIRNKKIGYIFQNYYLDPGYTVGEIMRNAMKIAGFTDGKEIARRTKEVLELVGLSKYEHKNGDSLSGGQKQRVAIARALIKGANIILADEPTGNLDAENTVNVMNILHEISKTKLVVLVTHETSLINRYADSHIELVDGVLQENTTVEDVKGYQFGKSSEIVVPNYSQSKGHKTGRLFDFRTLFHHKRLDSDDSRGSIFKKIFLCVMAAVICIFGFIWFNALSATNEHKSFNSNAFYTNLNTYSELSMIDKSLYDSIDFYELNQRDGAFTFANIASIASINEKYTPKALDLLPDNYTIYGNMPLQNQVLLSRGLVNLIKKDLRIKELESDDSVLLMKFNNDYSISGIIETTNTEVWFNKVDYVNFLGIYNDLKFVDRNNIFFKDSYANMTYSATIAVYEGNKDINDNQIVIDISRNSLYKMMDDTSNADYAAEAANKKLVNMSTAIYIENSQMYVKSFNITRNNMTTDIIIYVTQKTLDNLFIYLTPNIEKLGNDTNTAYYFEIATSNSEQYTKLEQRLKSRGISCIDINQIFDNEDKELLSQSLQIVYIYLIGIALVMLIYYFMEMSESIKNSKDYGVYRAIGVNKSNLLFKELIRVLIKNVALFSLIYVCGVILFAVYFGISNITFSLFILMSLGIWASSEALMLAISMIPYLFVITKTPSEIISRYDI